MYDDQMVSVRDFLNDGGKVLVTGQRALQSAWSQYSYNPLGRFPDKPQCSSNTSSTGPTGQLENCVQVSNDFMQYWMGAYSRANLATTASAVSALTITGAAPFTGSFSLTNQSFLGRFGVDLGARCRWRSSRSSSPRRRSRRRHERRGRVDRPDAAAGASAWRTSPRATTRADVLKQGLNYLGVTAYTNTTGGARATVPATLGADARHAGGVRDVHPGASTHLHGVDDGERDLDGRLTRR